MMIQRPQKYCRVCSGGSAASPTQNPDLATSPKSWPLQKCHGKNPKTQVLTYFASLNMMQGSKIITVGTTTKFVKFECLALYNQVVFEWWNGQKLHHYDPGCAQKCQNIEQLQQHVHMHLQISSAKARWWVGDAATMLFVQPGVFQTMKWVGTSMTLGAFISVRTFVTTHKTVLATLQVLKQDGGSEMPPQCCLYNQEVFKQCNGSEPLPLWPWVHP